ncbi:collagen alpha-3(VI) chain-like [Mytilus galloprovincialis]|uniref:collagen alpha-3(VI) chain-like n=1 Tax=Mytilus galloprovincialis TaxID=29158 RepID=UPI003F7BB36C
MFFFTQLVLLTITAELHAVWREYKSINYTIIRDSGGAPMQMSWKDARDECDKKGFALFSPKRDMMDWVYLFMHRNGLSTTWIGVNDRSVEGRWEWLDGSYLTSSQAAWRAGEPNDHESNEDCGVTYGKDWNDVDCETKLSVVCQIGRDNCVNIPCDNGGICSNSIYDDNLQCRCNNRYEGNTCEKDCKPSADLLFILDTSGSAEDFLDTIKHFITNIITRIPIGSNDFKVACITYNYDAHVIFDFSKHENFSSLTSAIQTIERGKGPTYTVNALRKAREILFDTSSGSRPNANKHIILLYDGLSTDRNSVYDEAKLLHRRTMLTAVGIGNSVGHSELVNIASDEDHAFTYLHQEDVYNRLLKDTADYGCTDCVLYSDVDIIIVFDAQVDDFIERREALGHVIDYLSSFGSTANISIGLVTNSTNPKYIFTMDWSKYKSKDDLMKVAFAVDRDSNDNGAMHRLLRFVKQKNGFLNSTCSAFEARQIVLLITNGKWSNVAKVKDIVASLYADNIEVYSIVTNSDISLKSFQTVLLSGSNLIYIKEQNDALQILTPMINRYKCSDDIFKKRNL